MSIRLLTVGNHSTRDYPGGFAPEEERVIRHWIKPPTLHLFCGMSAIGETRVDVNPTSEATVTQDVFEYLEQNTSIPCCSTPPITSDMQTNMSPSEAATSSWGKKAQND